jgi:hypothetical protein
MCNIQANEIYACAYILRDRSFKVVVCKVPENSKGHRPSTAFKASFGKMICFILTSQTIL